MKKFIVAVSCLAILILWLEVFLHFYQKTLHEQVYQSTEAELTATAAALESTIEKKASFISGIKSFLLSVGPDIEDYDIDTYLWNLMNDTSGIVNTAIFPDGKVKYVYPRVGNEVVLGYDLLADSRPTVKESVDAILSSNQIHVSGPIDLIQGGTGLISRQAIWLDGRLIVIGLVMDWDTLLEEASVIGPNKEIGLVICNDHNEVIYGDAQIFDKRNVAASISIPSGEWKMAAYPLSKKWIPVEQQLWQLRSLGYLLIMMIGLFILYLQGNRDRLKKIVDKRTQDLQQSEKKLEYLAFVDTLTDISNRNHFERELEAAMKQQEQSRLFKVTLMLFDIDHFKTVNDTFGHLAGDRLLQAIVQRIVNREGMRYIDFARRGGDEFVLLFNHLPTPEKASKVAAQLLELFHEPFWIDQIEIYMTPSIGIAISEKGSNAERLFMQADRAMYEAKSQGGNTFQVYQPTMEHNALEKIKLANEMRKALENEEFELHYQPQMDSSTGMICGMEALIRWNHPQRGFVSPGQFIPVAEETGLIIPISHWVLGEACKQNKRWQDKQYLKVPVSVNIPANLFRQGDFIETVRHALEEADLEARYLEIEITENVIMHEEHYGSLRRLQEMGVRISIDDFGTQYSSLSYLKRFPVEKIKIDKSFIDGIRADQRDEVIISSMIHVSKQLQLEVVAEGVETEEQLIFLNEQGCHTIQGYLFYRPMSVQMLNDYFQSSPASTSR
ncbi:bifunctional diguanylate cyclase/phosphodiesterase, partial [Marinicrinis sediminis]